MNRDTPEELVRELLSSNRGIAQDTMEDGFTTLHTKEGVPYIANLDPEEKARYSETKIPLSKIKKDGKGGKELTTGKKDKKADTDSNLTDLQKKLKPSLKVKNTLKKWQIRLAMLCVRNLKKIRNLLIWYADLICQKNTVK